MRKIRTAVCAALCAAMVMTFSACSITDFFDRLVSGTTKAAENEEEVVRRTEDDVFIYDDSLQKPVFVNFVTGSVTVPAGEVVVLDGTAALDDDGGELTFQWYTNNVNSNSGGTAIAGATDPFYTVDTSNVSDIFYFVVATNSHGKTYTSDTSGVREVVVRQRGTFTVDEFGGVRYLSDDGTFPTEMWMDIDGNTYHFTDVGYVSTGWLEYEGRLYYFDEASAILQRNITTPDGFQTDENGAMIPPEVTEEEVVEIPEGGEEAPEVPVEEIPAEEVPGEEGQE